jgi:hypothetical protein
MKGVIAIIATLASTASAFADVRVFESKKEAVTEGDAVLNCDPDTAYRAATDYSRWLQIFPGVTRASVTKQQGDEARVTFDHDDGTKDKLHFKNQPQNRAMWFEQVGGDADVWCWTTFQPGPAPGTTRVHTWFYADVSGAKSWFVDGDKIKTIRQRQVRTNLSQLQAYFQRNAQK